VCKQRLTSGLCTGIGRGDTDAAAALQGWWVGLGENDPQGHLLHVTPEYGRWTGKVYTPRDLADIKGFFEEGRWGAGLLGPVLL
jgi:hypothetical protein